ncbi:MAG: hypothetical protein H7331_07390 [Bacteroidia bacterium]|nr:hypothetical protein [Bacteroidia bacterium]
MKTLTITLIAITLLTSCSKNKTISSKGQVIEIANWQYNEGEVPLAGVRVCMDTYYKSSSVNFGAGGNTSTGEQTVCTLTDADGKFNLELEVNRKAYRKMDMLTYLPDQNGFILVRTDMSDGRNTGKISDKRNIFTLGAYRIYPVVLTLNNVNYLNDRDSLILSGNFDARYMGNQNNIVFRGFTGNKNSENPAVLGGGFAWILCKNGVRIQKENFNNKIILQNDTGYYTINY